MTQQSDCLSYSQLHLFARAKHTSYSNSFRPFGGNCYVRAGDPKLYSREEMQQQLDKERVEPEANNDVSRG